MSTLSQRFQSIVNTGFVCVSVASATTLDAQARRGTVQLRAGAALGVATTSVGGEKSTKVGPLLTGQFGVALSSRTDLTLELAVQPFKAHNPVRDEAFTGVFTLAGPGGLRRKPPRLSAAGTRPGVSILVRSRRVRALRNWARGRSGGRPGVAGWREGGRGCRGIWQTLRRRRTVHRAVRPRS
jgi:hypothetical protein